MSNNFSVELENLLTVYDEKGAQATKAAIEAVSKKTVDKLKSSSPRRNGKYADGWKTKKSGDGVVVYNSRYQLTHLLENGHIVRNKKGTYGRAPAYPHIAPAADWAGDELQNEVERRLNG